MSYPNVSALPQLLVTRMIVSSSMQDTEIAVMFTRGYDEGWGTATLYAAQALYDCGVHCVRRTLHARSGNGAHMTVAVTETLTLPAAAVPPKPGRCKPATCVVADGTSVVHVGRPAAGAALGVCVANSCCEQSPRDTTKNNILSQT